MRQRLGREVDGALAEGGGEVLQGQQLWPLGDGLNVGEVMRPGQLGRALLPDVAIARAVAARAPRRLGKWGWALQEEGLVGLAWAKGPGRLVGPEPSAARGNGAGVVAAILQLAQHVVLGDVGELQVALGAVGMGGIAAVGLAQAAQQVGVVGGLEAAVVARHEARATTWAPARLATGYSARQRGDGGVAQLGQVGAGALQHAVGLHVARAADGHHQVQAVDVVGAHDEGQVPGFVAEALERAVGFFGGARAQQGRLHPRLVEAAFGQQHAGSVGEAKQAQQHVGAAERLSRARRHLAGVVDAGHEFLALGGREHDFQNYAQAPAPGARRSLTPPGAALNPEAWITLSVPRPILGPPGGAGLPPPPRA